MRIPSPLILTPAIRIQNRRSPIQVVEYIQLKFAHASSQGRLLFINQLRQINDKASQRLARYTRHTRVDLHDDSNLRFGKVHHLGYVAGKEAAVSIADAARCGPDDDAQSVLRFRAESGGHAVEHFREE